MKTLDRSLLRFAFLLLALWLVFVAWAQHDLSSGAAPADDRAERRILILHAGAEEEAAVSLVAQLAGRFGQPVVRRLDSYRGGDLGQFAGALILPGASTVPAELLQEVRRAQRPVLWVGGGLEQLFQDDEFARAQGWAPVPHHAVTLSGIGYGGQQFSGSSMAVPLIGIQQPDRVGNLVPARTAEGWEAPWAIRTGRFAYVAEAPASTGASGNHLVFADLLFDIFAPTAQPRRRALIRIENVGAHTSPRRLRALVDLLHAQRVPFELSVREAQTFLDELREQPQLAAAIQHARTRGGTLALRQRLPSLPAAMPAAPFETVDAEGALVIPHNLAAAGEVARHLVVRDSLLSYSHPADGTPEALLAVVQELARHDYRFITTRAAVRAAPAHARLPIQRASAVSLAAAGWLVALPWIDLPILVALLALATSMWLGGEILLSRFDGPLTAGRGRFSKQISHKYAGRWRIQAPAPARAVKMVNG